MSWIVRVPPRTGAGAENHETADGMIDSVAASTLWDLGTTGLAEVSGELIAGFDNLRQAERAATTLRSMTGLTATVESVSDRGPATGFSTPNMAIEPLTVAWSGGVFDLTLTSNAVFGHGRHPTTRLALDLVMECLVADYLPSRSTPPVGGGLTRMLDLGTGTGVLAIAAARTGVVAVTAIDIDPLARSTARANAETNNVDISVIDASVRELVTDGHRFELVVANVLAPQHRQLADDVIACLTSTGGLVVVSGYLSSQYRQVVDAYRAASGAVNVVAGGYRGEWAGHLLQVTPLQVTPLQVTPPPPQDC